MCLWVIYRVKKEKQKKEKSNRSVLRICIVFLLIVFVVSMATRYISDEEFRDTFDTVILRKTVNVSNLNAIEINSDVNPYIYAYDRYITVLSKNTLLSHVYNGGVNAKFDVNISVPIMVSNGKYLVLAEKNGQKIYLISGSNILWQNDIEGNISKISVNKNGYVSVIVSNTLYKSVVILFDVAGNELFKTYISTYQAVCAEVSNSNKYLAIGEVDYSGTIIKSNVRIISVDLARSNPDESVVNTYESGTGEVITNIKYKDNETAICMFNTYVQKITPTNRDRIYEITSDDIFIDIGLKDSIAIVDKQSSGLFSHNYNLNIKNIKNKSDSLYILKSVPKTFIVNGNIMGLNFGNKIEIVNSNGWLLKSYTGVKEIQNLVLGDNIAGIVYKNKIEIINF